MTNKRVPSEPNHNLPLIPPKEGQISSAHIWRLEAEARALLSEKKGVAQTLPNQAILINAISLQEAKDSSEIENIVTSTDQLYKSLTSNVQHVDPQTKEELNYRETLTAGDQRLSNSQIKEFAINHPQKSSMR